MKLSSLLFCAVAVLVFDSARADERRPAWTTSRIAGSPEPPEPYKIVNAFPGIRFKVPTCLEEVPGAGRLLVTERGGRIYTFPKQSDAKQPDLLIDLNAHLEGDLRERGVSVFDAEFHPDFEKNRFLFVTYTHPAGGRHIRVSRFVVDESTPPRVQATSEQVVITWKSTGHNGGCLEFGKDGYLYISTGDGSGPNPPDGKTTGQDISDLLGAVLRLDINSTSDDVGYTIPADNPFVKTENARPEIWAYGLRNPWKIGTDPESGDVFAADNGWETWEMVHKIVRGGNCGWPIREGRAALRTEVTPGPTPIRPPVKDHPHTEANSVIGGPVYRGSKLPDLAGAFIYGDYITGTIWALQPDADQGYSTTTLVDTDQRIVAFTEGSAGELFVLDFDFTGQIYELLPSGLADTSADFPRRLSETGLFKSLAPLKAADGVVPYSVTSSRWTDGAHAERWVAIPGNGEIGLSTDGESTAVYPDGTVFVKHLTLAQDNTGNSIPVETQILHYGDARWSAYSYLWDDDSQEAHLVDSVGTDRPVKGLTGNGGLSERTWHVSASNECKLCHNPGSHFVLGFTPHQLNRTSPSADNQLATLTSLGVLKEAPTLDANDKARLVDPHDESAELDDRARSYLHANCAVCHHPGGNAIVSFYLRRDLPFDKLNTNKGTGIGTFGMQHAKIIVPGDPYRSVLFYRMSKLGYARMPYIGSRVVDSFGIGLIEEWIRSLPHNGDSISAPATPGTFAANTLESLARTDLSNHPGLQGTLEKLLSSTEGALALVAQMHRGSLSANEMKATLALGRNKPSDVRGLFDTFLPESERRAVLGANFAANDILSLKGDVERGKLIFFSDGARCRSCHEFQDRAKSLGPTLTEVVKKYPRRSEFLQHVMQPSLKIDDAFAGYTAITTSGRVISGLILEQSDSEVVLKTAEQQVVRLSRQEIDDLQRATTSLMPERILADLTAQEAADLLSYIRAQ